MPASLTRVFMALTLFMMAFQCQGPRRTGGSRGGIQTGTAEQVSNAGHHSADAISLPSRPASADEIGSQPGPESPNGRTLNWRDINKSPLSTVSIDVDTASYARSRLRIRKNDGYFPKDTVRPEDFLNYFPYAYAAPTDGRMVQIHQQLVASPWTPGAQVLAIGVKAKDLGRVDPAKNLVFLVDVSGSMAAEDKLPLVKASLIKLTDTLKPEDRMAIVTYAGYTEVVLDSTAGVEKDKIKQAINRLGAGGGTNGGSGISLAYDIAQKQFVAQAVNRVILATDGDFNLGITNADELVQLIRAKADSGIFLSILGFGDSSNDALMESVARDGNGNYFFIDTTREIDKVFGHDLKGNIVTIAKDVKIQIEFNPRLVKTWRLIGYAERQLQDDEFNKDEKDAGDLGSGQSVTYLYEITPRPEGEPFVGSYQPAAGVDPLIYQTEGALNAAADRTEIGTFKLRYKTPEGALSEKLDEPLGSALAVSPSLDVQWQLAVAETAVLLGGIQGLTGSYDAARARATAAVGDDPLGLRQEFLELLNVLPLQK
ncbi:MAG TPA: von Willebrand factor type A domain-containing protein [Oligoflexus sp.]|uniref:vWA domain-containing protein n=1 Tax=Oligoflexus sp. TaxID=1971216 RepID=UPI002D452C21|nr:von Willebrand factor type A domain-containing protein [Oligoflexus sp.]HYX36532.1 von Willebrand factor type A domain-containing protein [Oligoflexus sp.]